MCVCICICICMYIYIYSDTPGLRYKIPVFSDPDPEKS